MMKNAERGIVTVSEIRFGCNFELNLSSSRSFLSKFGNRMHEGGCREGGWGVGKSDD